MMYSMPKVLKNIGQLDFKNNFERILDDVNENKVKYLINCGSSKSVLLSSDEWNNITDQLSYKMHDEAAD